jgi:hypothetical protein
MVVGAAALAVSGLALSAAAAAPHTAAGQPPATYSQAYLGTIESQIRNHDGPAAWENATHHTFGLVGHEGDRILVTVFPLTAAVRAAARKAWGSAVILQVGGPINISPFKVPLKDVKITHLRGSPLHYTGDRQDDNPPFWGGEGIVSSFVEGGYLWITWCTSSFAGTNSDDYTLMLTAGHCGWPDNFTWYSGWYDTATKHLYQYDEEGTEWLQAFADDLPDAMDFSTQKKGAVTFSSDVFTSTATSHTGEAVTSDPTEKVGDKICTDGAVNPPEHCGAKITSTDDVVTVSGSAAGKTITATVGPVDLALGTSVFTVPGDSGGPVGIDNKTGQWAATGTDEGTLSGSPDSVIINELKPALAEVGETITLSPS